MSSREGTSKSGIEDLEGGLDIVLHRIFETKVSLTIKEITVISLFLAKAVSEGNFGEIPLKNLMTPSVRASAGKSRTSDGNMDGDVKKYKEGDYSDPEYVNSFLQYRKMGLELLHFGLC